jgi:gliding motility-associated-like protein
MCSFTEAKAQADMTVTVDTGESYATVSGIEYTPTPIGIVTYTLEGATTVSTTGDPGDASGNQFNIGVTKVTYFDNGTSVHEFLITVLPKIVMPSNLSRNNDPGTCAYIVQGTEFDPVVDVNGTGNYELKWKHGGGGNSLDGETINVGNQDVTWNFYFEINDIVKTETITISITDNENPKFTCPSGGTCNNDAGYCYAERSFTLTNISDNCSVATTKYSITDPNNNVTNGTGATITNHQYKIGMYTFEFQVRYLHGNTNSCTFTVTVTDNENPTLACPSSETCNNDAGYCYAERSFTLTGISDNCSVATTEYFITDPNNNITNGTGATITNHQFKIGMSTVEFQVTDIHGNNNSCTFTVTVTDNENPTLACPSSETCNNDAGYCYAERSFTLTNISDNCGVATTEYFITNPDNNVTNGTGETITNYPFKIGTYTVKFRVTDIHGNKDSCTFTVTVNDTQNPEFICPSSETCNNDPDRCYAERSFTLTGISDNCGVATTEYFITNPDNTVIPGTGATITDYPFKIGTSTVKFRVTDIHNNKDSCTFTVTVTDNENPTAVCKNATVQLGSDGALTLTDPKIINNGSYDNCTPAYSLDFSLSQSVFNCTHVGNNSVTLTVRDQYNNANTCTANITVQYHTAATSTVTPEESELCYNGQINLELSNPGFDNYTRWYWTTTSPSGISGHTAGNSPQGSGYTIQQTLTNNNNAVDTVFYTITPKVFAQECALPDISAIVLVNPQPKLVLSNDSNICDYGQVHIHVTSASKISEHATVYFGWSAMNINALVNGFGNGTNLPLETVIEETLHNTSYSPQMGVYTFDPYLVLNGNTCVSTHTGTYRVQVQPAPVLSVAVDQATICSEETVHFTASTANTGLGATWGFSTTPSIPADVTVTGTPITVAGAFNLTFENASHNKQTAAFAFLPHITIPGAVCNGAYSGQEIVINPVPEMSSVSLSGNDSICFDEGTIIRLQTSNEDIAGNMKYELTQANYDGLTVANPLTTGVYYDWQQEIPQPVRNNFDNVRTATYTFKPAIRIQPSKICSGKNGITVSVKVAPEIRFDLNPKKYAGNYNITCKGNEDGEVDILNLRGGWEEQGYTYVWTKNEETIRSGALTAGITGIAGQLTAGDYKITVTDKTLGCYSQSSVQLIEPEQLLADLDVTEPNCITAKTGSIVIRANGGARPYAYDITGAEGEHFMDSAIYNLRAHAMYYVAVTDANSCMYQNSPIHFPSLNIYPTDGQLNPSDITCYGKQDGGIRIILSSFSDVPQLFSYVWTYNGDTLKSDNKNIPLTNADLLLEGLNAGIYRLIAEDKNGCSYNFNPVEIVETQPVTFDYSISRFPNGYEVDCYGSASGSISVTNVAGGYHSTNPPYEYVWSPVSGGVQQGSPQQSDLKAGEYTLTIRNQRNIVLDPLSIDVERLYCDTTVTFTLRQPKAARVEAYIPRQNTYEVTCNGANTGAIDITATGNYTNYHYTWTPENARTDEHFNAHVKNQKNLYAGTYRLKMDYGFDETWSCSIDTSFTLRQPDSIKIHTMVADVSCYGGADGEINITASGGPSGIYSYRWIPLDETVITQPNQPHQQHLKSGTYWLIIEDALCFQTEAVEVKQPDPITANIRPENPSCTPGNDGFITLAPEGGTAPFIYLWSNGNSGERIDGLSVGTYSVDITDANGCTATATADIHMPTNLDVTAATVSSAECYGNTGKLRAEINNGRQPYVYQWFLDGTPVTIDLDNAVAGNYHLMVTDAFNCTGEADVTLMQPGKINLQATITDLICANDGNGEIQLIASGGGAPYLIAWQNGETNTHLTGLRAGVYPVTVSDRNNCTKDTSFTVRQPSAIRISFETDKAFCTEMPDGSIRTFVEGGTAPYSYTWQGLNATTPNISDVKSGRYTLEVTDVRNCTATAVAIVDYSNDACLRIPNAFSPNSDGVNDCWEIGVGNPHSMAVSYSLRDFYPEAIVEVYSGQWGLLLYRSQKGYPEPWDGKYNGKYLPVNSYVYIIRLNSEIQPITGNVTVIR